MTKIEQVARVLAEKAGAGATAGGFFRYEQASAYFDDMAKAAIGVLREMPDEALGIHPLMPIERARQIRADWAQAINMVLYGKKMRRVVFCPVEGEGEKDVRDLDSFSCMFPYCKCTRYDRPLEETVAP